MQVGRDTQEARDMEEVLEQGMFSNHPLCAMATNRALKESMECRATELLQGWAMDLQEARLEKTAAMIFPLRMRIVPPIQRS